MAKIVSCCCAHGTWLFSDPITNKGFLLYVAHLQDLMINLADIHCSSVQVGITSCRCDKECFICSCIHLRIFPSNGEPTIAILLHVYICTSHLYPRAQLTCVPMYALVTH